MRPLTTIFSGIGLAALTAITPAAIAPAMAQNPQADYAACDAYARQTVQPYLNQANAQGIGSAQYASADIQNMYNSYFASCMQSRGGSAYGAPAYGAPAYGAPAYGA